MKQSEAVCAPKSEDSARFGRSIAEHLADYQRSRSEAGISATHLDYVCDHVTKAAKRLGWATLADITADSIELYLHELTGHRGQKATPKYRKNVRGYLSAFMSWCVKRGRIDSNPVALIDVPKDTRGPQVRAFTILEMEQLVGWVTSGRAGGAEAGDVYRFVAHTGLRRREIGGLRVCDLHLHGESPYIEMPPSLTKSKKPERIPLVSRQVIDTLALRCSNKQPGDLVFPVVPHPNVVERDIIRSGLTKKDALGQRLTLHSLRHTLGTVLAQAGVAPKTAQLIMRHRDIRLTMQQYVTSEHIDTAAGMEAAARFFRKKGDDLKLTAQRADDIVSATLGDDPMLACHANGAPKGVRGNATGSSPVAPSETLSRACHRPEEGSSPHPQVVTGDLSASGREGRVGSARPDSATSPGVFQTDVAALLDHAAGMIAAAARVMRGGGQ